MGAQKSFISQAGRHWTKCFLDEGTVMRGIATNYGKLYLALLLREDCAAVKKKN